MLSLRDGARFECKCQCTVCLRPAVLTRARPCWFVSSFSIIHEVLFGVARANAPGLYVADAYGVYPSNSLAPVNP